MLIVAIGVFAFVVVIIPRLRPNMPQTVQTFPNSQTISPTATPFIYEFPYKIPTVEKNQSYRMIIVGDSIVATLGANANVLRLELKKLYPTSEFVTYNYGYPATSILALPDRLTSATKNGTAESPAILKQGFELIIIESFGYNPPSEIPMKEGLQKQREILDQSVKLILQEKPNAVLAFMTPIALSFKNYARNSYDLSASTRKQWVDERVAYIQNHKAFADEKGIPVIDVYAASLKSNGLVDETFVAEDYVHPSTKGISLISRTIANFIYSQKIFPE